MGGAIGLWAAAEWRRRWPAVIGIAVLVAIAGGAATALAAGAHRADTAYARFRDVTGEPNLAAQVDLGGAKPTSADLAAEHFGGHVEAVDELAALDGVESVAVESWWAIALDPEISPDGTVTAFATGTFATAGEPPRPIVIDGRLPGADDPRAVTINEEAVRELGLGVGSTLTFDTASAGRLLEWATNDGQFASADALDGPTIEVRVAAVTRSEADLEAPFPAIEFSEGFARAHGDDIAHIEVSVEVRADPDRRAAVAAAMEDVLAPYELEMTTPDAPGAAILPSIEVGVSTLWIATAITAVGGLLVVGQALGRLVAASATDRPALAAMGLTRPQQTLGSIAVAMVGIAGGALAVPLVAWSASGLFPRGAAALAEPVPGLRWDGPTLLAGAAVTFVAASVTVALIAVAASRRRSSRAGAGRPLTTLLSGRPAMSLGASFAADPAGTGRRSRAVAGAAAASVAVAVAAVLVVTTLESSRRHLDASPSDYGAAAELVFESNGTFGLAAVVDRALDTPGVTAVTRQLAINDGVLVATGPSGAADVEPEAYDTPRGRALIPVAEGRYPQDDDEAALGPDTAAALGVRVGDEVTIEGGDGTPVVLSVTGVVSSWDTTDPGDAFVVQPERLRTMLCPDDTLDECNLSANLFASAGDEASRAALLEAGFVDVTPPANVTRLGQVGLIPGLLAGFLCLFAIAGLVHAVLTSQRRRARDLAIVRALGLGPRPAAAALTWQAVLTVAIGTAAGLVLGTVVGKAIWRVIADDLGVIAVTRLPVLAVAAVAAGAVVAAVAVSVWPRWRAARVLPATALRSE